MNQPKRKLKINMTDLELAFESRDDLFDFEYFLDLESGEVIMTTGEESHLLEEIMNYTATRKPARWTGLQF